MKIYLWKHEQINIIPNFRIYVDPIATNYWLSIDISWLRRSFSIDFILFKVKTKKTK
jgi:hypothetical protein